MPKLGLVTMLCLLAVPLLASDAVTINADGTAVFSASVSGPNLLGTANTTGITAAVTLDASAAGHLYTVGGTTQNYAITLPNAAIGSGVVIGFSVGPWPSATKQYVLTPAASSGQTIDGKTSLALIYTNYVELMSVGGNWVARVKKVDTDWVGNGETLTFTATTAPPNKGGAIGPDAVRWKRIGDSVVARYEYFQGTASSSVGSGDYMLALPNGLHANLSAVGVNTTVGQIADGLSVGEGWVGINASGAAIGTINAHMYDDTRFRLGAIYTDGATTTRKPVSSSYFHLATANYSLAVTVFVPISGW